MPTHAGKKHENKKQPTANKVSQKRDDHSPALQFVDNRPEAIAQRALQEVINSSSQVKQAAQLQVISSNYVAQHSSRKKNNNTGLPDSLKVGVEALSGHSMDDVKVHYNSDQPARLQAHAYAQGTDIHLAPGQEKHLPHEAWHVVQQKQGRVKSTMQLKENIHINNDPGLEREADIMGMKSAQSAGAQLTDASEENQPSGVKILQAKFTPAPTDTEPTRHFDDFLGSYIDKISTIEGYEPWQRFYQPAEKSWWIYMPATDYRDERYVRSALFNLEELREEEEEAEREFTKTTTPEAEEEVDKFVESAKVGLELTFNSPESKQYIKNDGFPLGKTREAERWWEDELIGWTKALEHSNYVYENNLEVRIDKSHEQKDIGGGTGAMENWRVIYVNDDESILWWWQLSMDPGVVEIQTAPASGADLSEGVISEIVDTIYKRAQIRGFSPGGGGGHINVDFETGFGGDPSLIPKVLIATEWIIESLRGGMNEAAAELVDFDNELEDPFLNTKRVKMQTNRDNSWNPRHLPDSKDESEYFGDWERDVAKKSGARVKDMQSLKTFREAHAKWLHLHPTLSQQKGATERTGKLTEKADKAGLSAVLHYQAVNIDHLFEDVVTKDEEVIEDPRRLEFRFFKGQGSIDEIIACLKLISEIVKEAKKIK